MWKLRAAEAAEIIGWAGFFWKYRRSGGGFPATVQL